MSRTVKRYRDLYRFWPEALETALRVSEACAAARASKDANHRGQIYITVLQPRLKEFQLEHLDEIQEQVTT